MKRSTMTVQRIQWTCPICKRRYAIPAAAPTPSRCPQCRQAEEEEERVRIAPPPLEAADEPDDEMESEALSALAAIQLEVVEEAVRGPMVAAPALRRGDGIPNTLPTLVVVYTVLAGLAVVAAVIGLLYGLHAAFASPATQARTYVIFGAIGAFAGGLIAAIVFFTFRELIRILLSIEENTRPR
jgi:hypothetical protein